MTRPAFGGNLMATIECAVLRPQMGTIRQGVFQKLEKDPIRQGLVKNIEVSLQAEDIRTQVIKKVKSTKKPVDITEAKFITSGGRDLGTKENFSLLQDLEMFLVEP